MSTKKDRVFFIKEVEKIILEKGGNLVGKPLTDTRKEFEIKGEVKGSKFVLNLFLYPEDGHKDMYTVYARYDVPNAYFGNDYSGKHNFFSTQKDVDFAVQEFDFFLTRAMELYEPAKKLERMNVGLLP